MPLSVACGICVASAAMGLMYVPCAVAAAIKAACCCTNNTKLCEHTITLDLVALLLVRRRHKRQTGWTRMDWEDSCCQPSAACVVVDVLFQYPQTSLLGWKRLPEKEMEPSALSFRHDLWPSFILRRIWSLPCTFVLRKPWTAFCNDYSHYLITSSKFAQPMTLIVLRTESMWDIDMQFRLWANNIK